MKIGFVGSISVGKTTLVNELAKLEQFKEYYIATERSKYLRDLGIPLNTDSTLLGQTIFLSERCSELLRGKVLTDRSIIDVMAFTNLSKSMSTVEKESFCDYASNIISLYDHVFYVSPEGVKLEDNGVRAVDAEYRDQIDEEIKYLLGIYKSKIKNFHVISGTVEERMEQVKQSLSL
jgi:deoxyadenosine/deoxycytidine kinase